MHCPAAQVQKARSEDYIANRTAQFNEFKKAATVTARMQVLKPLLLAHTIFTSTFPPWWRGYVHDRVAFAAKSREIVLRHAALSWIEPVLN